MGRSPSNSNSIDIKKGPWDPEEDKKLLHYINQHGPGNWIALPKLAGLNRCGKSCRLRWINYLRPEIKRGSFTHEEEHTILQYHKILGNKWSLIAKKLPGRTDNEIKNFWNTHMKKKLIRAGCDPITHQPRTDLMSCLRSLLAIANLKNMILRQNPNFQDYKLPYLQQIDQIPVNSISIPALLKQNPNLISDHQQQLENRNEAATSFQPLHHPMMINNNPQDSHVPFAYNASQFQPTTSFDDGSLVQSLEFDQHDSFWNMLSSNFPSTSEQTTSISNAGEVTSTLSYNHGSEEEEAAYTLWEELLVDPVME